MDSEMFLAKRKAIRQHRRMWRWIYRETLKRKRKVAREEYFSENKIEEDIFNNCYCCEFDFEFDNHICRACPLNWGSYVETTKCADKYERNDREGLWAQWNNTMNWRKAAKFAKQIAKLPERDL